jgi:pyridoxamine 5'-phosphate oxidase
MSEEAGSDFKVAEIRREYAREELLEESVEQDPINQFAIWFEQALRSRVIEPNAMSLGTVGEGGYPSVRIVLLKGFDSDGFRFFTNYNSRKGRELENNPQAALCFFWPELERQVRVEGKVSKLSREESEEYFNSRPRLSRLGAWASNQSSELASRAELEQNFEDIRKKFDDNPIPVPDFWGGFLLIPSVIEFWQGREGRMHDRIQYTRQKDEWKQKRLSP